MAGTTALSPEWEPVNHNTVRMRVPGGWIVKSTLPRHETVLEQSGVVGGKIRCKPYFTNPCGVTMCFVPDLGWEWKIATGGEKKGEKDD